MTAQTIAFIIGASGGFDEPAAWIKRLEPNLLVKTFDAAPDQEGIAATCFWSSPGIWPFFENKTRFSSGLLPAEPRSLDYIQENGLAWRSEAELIRKTTIQTTTLDIYCQDTGLWPEFLSMDIQGAEYEVLKGGSRAISRLLAIITEVEFRQLYAGQKLFAHIDTLLKAASFEFINLFSPQYWRLSPADSQKALSVGEALYLRQPDRLKAEERTKLAAIAKCFGLEGYA